MKIFILIFLTLMILVSACSTKEQAEPELLFAPPANFPKPIYDMTKNPITQDGFALGKALFYDPILSRDGTISCGECHRQDFGFTHHGHDISHGIDNLKGIRNSLALQNLAWQPDFFWDGGVGDLDFVPIAPIENPVEMDEKTGNVLEKLRKTTTYPTMFKKAFGTDKITSQRFLKALSQFMLSLVSANSRYDKYVRNEDVSLTTDELAGMNLFKQKCSSCHAGELFSDNSFRNNGLTIQGEKDEGRFRITENVADKYKFKVPSLRNISATKPYMHDGRFFSLDAVLDHYAGGVQNTPNLDEKLKENPQLGIPLSAQEKQQIIAFLQTLTDEEFLTNKRFSEN